MYLHVRLRHEMEIILEMYNSCRFLERGEKVHELNQ